MLTEVPRSSIDFEQIAQEVYGGRAAKVIDRAILQLAPRWAAKRLAARQEAGVRRAMLAYGSISTPYNSIHGTHERPMVHQPLGTEESLMPGFDRFQMLLEARQLYRNSPIIRAMVDGIARRVGSPKPHFHTSDKKWNEMAQEQYEEWVNGQCDYRGALTMAEMDEQIVRSCYTDGDIGEILCDCDGDLKLQLIEGDRIAPDYRVNINIDTMNPMSGVVIDWETGRVKGYMVGKRGVGGLLVDSEFYPAEEMKLYFRPYRVDNVRGYPLLAPVINPAKDLERYLNAVRISMNVAASYGVFIQRENAAQFALAQSESVTGSNPAYRTTPIKTGLMTWLNPGESVTQLKPEMPGPDFDPVSRFMVRIIARGGGSVYEMVMGDFSGMSYSASKTVLLFEWQMQNEWQDWLITRRHRPIYNVWVAKRMESKLLPFNPEAFDKVGWIKAPRSGFDPLEDAEAMVKLLGAGVMTYRRIYSALGLNEEVELRQAAKEAALIYQLAKEEGIPPEAIASTLAPGILPGGGAAPTPSGPGTTRRGGAQDGK